MSLAEAAAIVVGECFSTPLNRTDFFQVILHSVFFRIMDIACTLDVVCCSAGAVCGLPACPDLFQNSDLNGARDFIGAPNADCFPFVVGVRSGAAPAMNRNTAVAVHAPEDSQRSGGGESPNNNLTICRIRFVSRIPALRHIWLT